MVVVVVVGSSVVVVVVVVVGSSVVVVVVVVVGSSVVVVVVVVLSPSTPPSARIFDTEEFFSMATTAASPFIRYQAWLWFSNLAWSGFVTFVLYITVKPVSTASSWGILIEIFPVCASAVNWALGKSFKKFVIASDPL